MKYDITEMKQHEINTDDSHASISTLDLYPPAVWPVLVAYHTGIVTHVALL